MDLKAKNTQTAWGADLSEKFDLTKEDEADDLLFNEVIWRSVKGPNSPMPAPVRAAWVFPHKDNNHRVAQRTHEKRLTSEINETATDFSVDLGSVFSVSSVVRSSVAAEKRPMTIDDLFRFKRVADPQISPDGTQVVYVVDDHHRPGQEQDASPTSGSPPTDGKTPPRQLTTTDKKDRHPRWSPDGKRILFESTRSGGEPQLWIIDLDGGEARQLTHVSTGAGNAIWSRDGSHIAFVSAVFPEFSEKPFAESDKLNKERLEAEEEARSRCGRRTSSSAATGTATSRTSGSTCSS